MDTRALVLLFEITEQCGEPPPDHRSSNGLPDSFQRAPTSESEGETIAALWASAALVCHAIQFGYPERFIACRNGMDRA
jgi:hypothetical protein